MSRPSADEAAVGLYRSLTARRDLLGDPVEGEPASTTRRRWELDQRLAALEDEHRDALAAHQAEQARTAARAAGTLPERRDLA